MPAKKKSTKKVAKKAPVKKTATKKVAPKRRKKAAPAPVKQVNVQAVTDTTGVVTVRPVDEPQQVPAPVVPQVAPVVDKNGMVIVTPVGYVPN